MGRTLNSLQLGVGSADSRALESPRVARSRSASRGRRSGRHPQKLGSLVAAALEREVMRLGWPVGRVLGTEAQLMARFKVSRATLREGIRQIERHGIAEMRRGLGGGLVVSESARQATASVLTTYLELTHATPDDIVAARIALEAPAARLAAKRVDPVATERLQEMLDTLRRSSPATLGAAVEKALELRQYVAQLSGNPAIALFMDAVNDYAAQSPVIRSCRGAEYDGEIERVCRAQQEIIKALLARSPGRAEQAVLADLQAARRFFARLPQRQRYPLVLRGGGKQLSSMAADSGHKLCQSLAVVIARDIVARGLEPGTRLGAEPDLMERYDVSRAVLREALRVLERHGIARTQRGSGGGLVVGTPDPTYTAESAILYLQHVRLDSKSIQEVRQAVEAAAVEMAAQFIQEARFEDLAHILTQEHFAALRADRETAADPIGVGSELIAALCGSRVLGLYLRVLSAVAGTRSARVSREHAHALATSYTRVLEAVQKQDTTGTRKRLLALLRQISRLSSATTRA